MRKRQVSETVSKRDCLLDPNQISELIMDSNSDEPLSDVVAMKDEEYCEEVSLEPYLRSKRGHSACSSIQAPLSLDSASTSEETDGCSDLAGSTDTTATKLAWALPSHLHTAKEERMTVKYHTTMTDLRHVAF